ncbi:MAG: alpha/beta hydrolase-fold protein [Fimbriimonas sp.]|nr:alpha/beta hydrolase-fold protein [Fimbriimonas sp.]
MLVCIGAIMMAQVAQALQSSESFSRPVTISVEGRYLLYLPPDYSKDRRKKFPLLLFLHGSGERGRDLEMVKRHGPPKEIEKGRQFEFVILSPQCDERGGWQVPTLTGLLDEAEHRFRIDKDREYVTGLSMGGMGTYALAAAQPKRFAAIAPVSAAANVSIAPKIKDIPIWATHGAMDPTVNISGERPLIDELTRLGAEVKYDVIPDGQHDVWTPVYQSNALYDWLLRHVRRKQR